VIRSYWVISCDTCSWWDARTQGATRAEAIRKARTIGWHIGTDGQTCNLCRPTSSEQEEAS
jgi:hypothetical protein